MDLASNAVTAVVTLLAVTLGGWLSTRNQDRSWQRDHARQWRDIRLAAYREFLSAYREFIAFVNEPTAAITATPHPRHAGEMMAFFDERGTRYKERFDATITAALLVSDQPQTEEAIHALFRRARRVAAERAVHSPENVPSDAFSELWEAQAVFVAAARRELGLAPAARQLPSP